MRSVRINLEIENRPNFGNIFSKYEVYQLLLTDYNSLFDYTQFNEDLKNCIKQMKNNWTMLTIDLSKGDYPYTLVSSVRFLKKDGLVTMSHSMGNRFENWNEISGNELRAISLQLQCKIDEGNQLFMDTLRQLQNA